MNKLLGVLYIRKLCSERIGQGSCVQLPIFMHRSIQLIKTFKNYINKLALSNFNVK